jgi:hypothetical protein
MADQLDEALATLRRLNLTVPSPLALPTESEVSEVEARTGVRFPADLRRYLLGASDVVYGTIEPVTIGGGHTSFEAVLQNARQSGVPNEVIPICEDNGDFYCIEPSGAVVFWSHSDAAEETWPSLATWISDVWIGGN